VPRADTLLAERGYFESRAKAREAIEAGLVTANGRKIKKASEKVSPEAAIVAEAPYPWVSRGGVKLAHALDVFGVDPSGRFCLDVGASTGGFTDVLLAKGARHVVAIDVGHGQLHPRIAGDARVTSYEGLDARALGREHSSEPPSLVVCDASFISLSLLLAPVLAQTAEAAEFVGLVKPQFEAGPAAAKKGIVRDAKIHEQVCRKIRAELERLGWRVAGLAPSPIEGGDGNKEFLVWARKPTA